MIWRQDVKSVGQELFPERRGGLSGKALVQLLGDFRGRASEVARLVECYEHLRDRNR